MTTFTHDPATSLLVADDLGVTHAADAGPVDIVTNVSFRVAPGEAIGIVGESGSGKSITARAVMGLLPSSMTCHGRLTLAGTDLTDRKAHDRQRLRGRELSLVMQDPFTMLNPVERCGRQIMQPLTRVHRDGDVGRDLADRLAEVGIDDPRVGDRYPFELSGGLQQRVGIAAAIARDPRVLIADEPTTALDVTTQRQVLALLARLRQCHHMALVLITHDLNVAFEVCDRIYVMYAGTVVESGTPSQLARDPSHPYTAGLLNAEPPVGERLARLQEIPGAVPAPGRRPDGCVFAPRCAWRQPACDEHPLPMRTVSSAHDTRCLRMAEITTELVALRRPPAASPPPDRISGASDALLSVQSVRKVFGTGRAAKVALDGVTLKIGRGEAVGLVGESGSGKTTLGRCVVGLQRADAGSLEIAGVQWGPAGIPRPARHLVRSAVQMVFQDPYTSLNPARSVGATVREALRAAGTPRNDTGPRVEELLAAVGLPNHYQSLRPAVLSGGERQRVAIARGLARDPELLVCDEVVSALDVSVQAQILNLLRTLQHERGIALLFITHDLGVVRQVTDRVCVMRDGQIVDETPTDRLMAPDRHPYTRELIDAIPHGRHQATVAHPQPDPEG